MIPPNEFFNMPYMQKKTKKFTRSYVPCKTSAEVKFSILESFKQFYIQGLALNREDEVIGKLLQLELFDITEDDIKFVKGEQL